uniref:Uncharacterized protein n=1 Tax=Anguilla anguilla TaxID=7936 RepID=A0A0E9VJA9_ANGAN
MSSSTWVGTSRVSSWEKSRPVSLSRTRLMIWMAFLFKASGCTRPSPMKE